MSMEALGISDNWETAQIGECVVDTTSGFACAKKHAVPEGLPHLRPFNVGTDGELDLSELIRIPTDFNANVERYSLESGDVLFNNTNSVELVGKVAIVREPIRCAFSNHITRLRVDEARLLPEWLVLSLRQLWISGFFAARCRKWIGQAGFNTTMLKGVEIPLPPLDEQRRIVARIEELFARIKEARWLRAAADKDAEGLFDAALEQTFDNSRAGSSETLALQDFATVFNGRASGWGDSNVRVFKTRHVYPFDLRMTDPSYMKPEQVAKCPPDKYLRDDDVLICNIARGTLGRVCHIQKAEDNWTVDTQIMVLRPDERCLGKWLFYYLYSRRGQAEILAREKGTAFADKRGQTHLYVRDMKTVPVPLPSLAEQCRTVEYLDGIQAKVAELKGLQAKSLAEVKRLEQSILARAFRGEL